MIESVGSSITSEQIALKGLREKGSKAYKLSWPDLIERDKDGRMFLVEVKKKGDRLSWQQKKSFLKLQEFGFLIKIVRVDRDTIYEYTLGEELKGRNFIWTRTKKRGWKVVGKPKQELVVSKIETEAKDVSEEDMDKFFNILNKGQTGS